MAKLIVISGEERQEFELAAFNTIGRHPDNTIQILDRIISKEHAQILHAGTKRVNDVVVSNGGRVLAPEGDRLGDYVVSDYLKRRSARRRSA